jgi:hypothetical protein
MFLELRKKFFATMCADFYALSTGGSERILSPNRKVTTSFFKLIVLFLEAEGLSPRSHERAAG